MGHIAFGAPGIASYHLHERLRRALQQRGHAVTVLCTDASGFSFWRHQGETVIGPQSTPVGSPAGDHAEWRASLDRRTAAWLGRLQPHMERWFETANPDLLLLHQRRGPDQQLLQFLARRRGCRVLWCGDGLLPHTLQFDERGLDGDASICRRSAIEFRAVQGDTPLLQACLANALAGSMPCALPRREPIAPSRWQRCADLWPMWRDRGARAAARSLRSWATALAPLAVTSPPHFELPARPFGAVLLQDDDDLRMQHDAGTPPPARELIAAARAALHALDPGLEMVVVDSVRSHGHLSLRPAGGDIVVPAAAAAAAASIAVATITINHPMAITALLAGTPVLHLGAALYGLRGVTERTTLSELGHALPHAIAHDHPSLRQRFLTWLLGYGHVWCSGTDPDHNGLLGFVQAIERRLQGEPGHAPRLDYRRGPAWPLSSPARRQ